MVQCKLRFITSLSLANLYEMRHLEYEKKASANHSHNNFRTANTPLLQAHNAAFEFRNLRIAYSLYQ